MQTEKIKFTSIITNKITLMVNSLQNEMPSKGVNISASETKMFWSVNWKSTKHLKESFQVEIWGENEKFSLMGEHLVEGVFEHSTEEYFLYEDKTVKELQLIIDEIIQKTKKGILESIN